MSETLVLIAGGIGFLLAGVGIGIWITNMRLRSRVAEADELQQKFDAYRRDVTEHFGRTAEHFQAIGNQYRELYEHLASGADSFCDAEMVDEKLVYEPAPAIAASADETSAETSAGNADESSSERPRDYAEGEGADEDTDTRAATDGAGDETSRPAASAEARADDGDGGKKEGQAGDGGDEDRPDTVDDLKPEVKSDAEEKPSRPTLH